MQALQCLHYARHKSAWTDNEYDKFCSKHGLDGNGGCDIESFYSEDVIAIANKLEADPSCFSHLI